MRVSDVYRCQALQPHGDGQPRCTSMFQFKAEYTKGHGGRTEAKKRVAGGTLTQSNDQCCQLLTSRVSACIAIRQQSMKLKNITII